MNKISIGDIEDHLRTNLIIEIKTDNGIQELSLNDIEPTPPIRRASMARVDLVTQVSFMPRDHIGKLTAWIGDVVGMLFSKGKV